MAKIVISPNLGFDWLADRYGPLTVSSLTSTKIILSDGSGGLITFTGKGFKGSDSGITAGTVKTATFATSEGTLLSITGGNFKAKALSDAYTKFNDLYDLLTGLTAGNDTILGSNRDDDIIIGDNAGNDKIIAGDGDDFIKGSAGNNTIDGGAGFDTLSYDPFTATPKGKGVVVDMAKGTAKNAWGGTDTFKNIEEVRGTNAKDVILGSAKNDRLSGLKGADKLDGGAGTDVVDYARDERFGGKKGIVADLGAGKIKDGFGTVDKVSNIENIRGTRFADSFKGDDADNVFRGLDGVDSYDGGHGNDALSFYGLSQESQPHGATVDLRLSSAQIIDDGYGNTESATSIESLEGSIFDDDLTLGSGKDAYAWGDDGDDRLVAGSGQNWLGGGEGADRFVFLSKEDSRTGSGETDFIDDFSGAEGDTIDLSALGELTYVDGGEHEAGVASVVWYAKGGNTIVSADTDADGISDFEVTLRGSITLSDSDFIL